VDTDSESSDGLVDLHSTDSTEHRLINQVDEVCCVYDNLQKLITALSDTVRQTVSCYESKLYVFVIHLRRVG